MIGQATENITQQTLDLMKTALGTPSEELRKSVTTGTGLVPFDLRGDVIHAHGTVAFEQSDRRFIAGRFDTKNHGRPATIIAPRR